MGITISPSSTNVFAERRARAATSSGKYRVSGLPDFDCRSIFLRSRNARQRKPSHLGSYCHCSPNGRLVAGAASMAAYAFEMGNVTEALLQESASAFVLDANLRRDSRLGCPVVRNHAMLLRSLTAQVDVPRCARLDSRGGCPYAFCGESARPDAMRKAPTSCTIEFSNSIGGEPCHNTEALREAEAAGGNMERLRARPWLARCGE